MKDLTQGSTARNLVSFSMPMLLGNVFQQLYNMVDSMVVGHFVGKEALAAVGASFPVLFLLVSLFMGVGMGANVLIAQFYGAKRFDKVKAAIETTYLVSFWGGIALTVLGYVAAGPIMDLLQSPPEVKPQAVLYLQVLCLGMLPSFGYNTVSAVLRGLGDSKTPLYMLMVSTVLNIVLDLVFVMTLGWGVAGVAVATVISQGVAFVWALVWLEVRNPLVRTNLLKMKFDPPVFKESLRIGLPSGLQQSMVALGLSALTGIINTFGTNAIAAFAAASRIESFATMPAMSIGMAVSTFAGQNLGAGRKDRVRQGFRDSLWISGSVAVAASVLVWFAGEWLIGLFNGDQGVIQEGVNYLRIVGPFYIVFTVMFMANGVIRGAGEAMVPLLSTILAMWLVRVPLAFFFAGIWGIEGVWWAMPTGWMLGMVVSLVYYRSGRWELAFAKRMARSGRGAPGAEAVAPVADSPLAPPGPEEV